MSPEGERNPAGSTGNKEDINTVEFIEARAREIQAIEDSIKRSNKKTMLFQRLPFYKRRRNRNYDKRGNRTDGRRKQDRHFLRTHTFYSKRFFMLKLNSHYSGGYNGTDNHCTAHSPGIEHGDKNSENLLKPISLPLKRRIKSSKFIYKSQKENSRGFVFDESFRGCIKLTIGEFHSEFGREHEVYAGEVRLIGDKEVAFTGDCAFVIGSEVTGTDSGLCVLSIMRKESLSIGGLLVSSGVVVFRSSGGVETHKVICPRSTVMGVYQRLIHAGVVPICLEEIHRLALEGDEMTIYDRLDTGLGRSIEESMNREIVWKYNRTPRGKRQSYDLGKLFLCGEFDREKHVYGIFKVIKGNIERCAEISEKERPITSTNCTNDTSTIGGTNCTNGNNSTSTNSNCTNDTSGTVVGRVIRGGFKFTGAQCYGLGFIEKDKIGKIDQTFLCRNLTQKNHYEIVFTKLFP